MEYMVKQVMQKDLGRRLQVGQEIIDYILDRQRSYDLGHDQTMLDRMVDGLATSWINSSNFKVKIYSITALLSRRIVITTRFAQLDLTLSTTQEYSVEMATFSAPFIHLTTYIYPTQTNPKLKVTQLCFCILLVTILFF